MILTIRLILDNPLDLLDQERLMGDLERKRSLFQGRIYDKSNEVKAIEHIYEKLRRQIYELSEQNIHRMITKLETLRNISFEEGKSIGNGIQAEKTLSNHDLILKLWK